MPSVQSTLRGRRVFVTGFTGLVGKCLVRKLLVAVPEIEAIIVLIRNDRRHPVAADRFASILREIPFNDLEANLLAKIIMVEGDLSHDFAKLDGRVSNIDVVVHAAATVNFEESMKQAVDVNVAATNRLLDYCCTHIRPQVFVHVSTAYAHCDQMSYITEQIPNLEEDPIGIIRAFNWMTSEMGDAISPHLLKTKPNSYIYTKALTENLVRDRSVSTPFKVAIVRPTIIGAAWREPFPGFIDNYNAVTGALAAYGHGVWRVSTVDPNVVFDCIPVDLCVDGMIATISYMLNRSADNKIFVTHLSSSAQNPSRWKVLDDIQTEARKNAPFENAFRYPKVFLFTDPKYEKFFGLLLQEFFIKVYDMFLIMFGSKIRLTRISQRIKRLLKSTMFFVWHQWSFEQTSFDQLCNSLTEEDRKILKLSAKEIVWQEYYTTYYLGVKKYLLKENTADMQRAFKRQMILKVMFYVGEPLIVLLAVFVVLLPIYLSIAFFGII